MTSAGAYAYRALRTDGSVQKGQVVATSVADARAALERDSLLTLEVHLVSSPRDRRTAISAADLGLGLRILADLFAAGLSMTRALQTFSELAPAAWQSILPQLRESVRQGKSFGAALRDAPAEIPPVVVGIAVAGEMAGDLTSAVRRAAEVTEAIAATRAALRNALAYPIVLAVAGAGAVGLMIGVVIPRFATILADIGQDLPPTTRLVMTGATAIRDAFVPALIVLVAVVAIVRSWTRSEHGRVAWHSFLLAVPLVGSVRRSASTARATFTLATLLDTGVPLRQAIPFAAQASGDAALAARMRSAGARIETGSTIGRAVKETQALTPLAIRLIHAGEESGRLTVMLRHAAKLEEERSERLTKTAVRLLEPALILVFAGVVALVAAALLQAVYSVRPTA